MPAPNGPPHPPRPPRPGNPPQNEGDSYLNTLSKQMSEYIKKLGENSQHLGKLTTTLKNVGGQLGGALSLVHAAKTTTAYALRYAYSDRKFGEASQHKSLPGRMANTLQFGGQGIQGKFASTALRTGKSIDEITGIADKLAKSNLVINESKNGITKAVNGIVDQANGLGMRIDDVTDIVTDWGRDFGYSAEESIGYLKSIRGQYATIIDASMTQYGLEEDRMVQQKEYNEGLFETVNLLKDQKLSVKQVSKAYSAYVAYFTKKGFTSASAIQKAKELTATVANYKSPFQFPAMQKVYEGLKDKFQGSTSDDIQKSLMESAKLNARKTEDKTVSKQDEEAIGNLILVLENIN